ncbi:MAG TPA: exosortase H-associated membrane protein, partial [Casimicrobiaceae bacterium]|nr:exosortase H-associated membrane protein [Casimicrobiaceae bacterium]
RAVIVFATTLKPGIAGPVSATVTVEVNCLLYAFGMPLFAALTLAGTEANRLRILAIGYVALLPVVAWGVLADFLKNVAITSGPLVASQTGFSSAQREVIAFAFQFGSLILPTVIPAIVWVLTHRAFLLRMREESADAALT